MTSSKPADVTFNSALFVGAGDAGLAVEGIDVEMRAERDPAVGFDSLA
jgi:hypothetical protein